MKFKYQSDYEKLAQTCPPINHLAQEIDPVFRWVFDSIDDDRNFKSQFHRKPKRFLNSDDATKCRALGLSMFNDKDGSVDRFQELKENIGDNIFQTLGTKLAQGTISKPDGVNGKVEGLGHFNHHPSSIADYTKKFKIIDQKL